ncbi:MAG: von Willebrand factor type A domain-containing protein, partial [Planctomycetota bacterium]|nr:von Willebrand factor type A domain-containing protein [Planctomycetota bacterium]
FNDFGDQSAADDLSDGRDNSLGDFYDDDSDTRARAELTEEQLNKLTAAYSDDFFRSCQPKPSERPRDMFFRFYGDNPFEYAPQDKRSTFSVDVDTASYTLSRSYLSRGLLPEKAQVRTEEFLNYFDADLPAPNDDVFAITTEVAPSRFGGTPDRLMLRVGVRGKEISKEERDPLALTFVVDVSGSMREGDRLELVKHALRLLLTQLDARDRISLVAFSNEARVVLPMTPATERALIEAALHPLQPGGGTNAEAGLTVGYELAMTGIDPKVTSRVIFLSDGVANIGQTDQDRLGESVTRQREQGIYLNTVGVGMNNHNDVFLERLADQGDGVCDYVDDADSAKRALVDRFTGALLPIASDVKVQVVFDESVVARYRLLGYENRAIADADFRNDAVDAGEIGAGHQVVALYELDLAPRAEPLASGYPMASVLLRWKEPKRTGQHPLEIQVTEIEKQVAFPGATTPFAETSLGFRRNALVAQFAEFLRRSTHAQGDSIQELLAEATALAPLLNDGDFDEFVTLVRRAEPMLVAEQIRVLQNELGITMNEYRRLAYNRALLAELNLIQGNAAVLEGIRDANLEVEGQIRDLIYRQLKNR